MAGTSCSVATTARPEGGTTSPLSVPVRFVGLSAQREASRRAAGCRTEASPKETSLCRVGSSGATGSKAPTEPPENCHFVVRRREMDVSQVEMESQARKVNMDSDLCPGRGAAGFFAVLRQEN